MGSRLRGLQFLFGLARQSKAWPVLWPSMVAVFIAPSIEIVGHLAGVPWILIPLGVVLAFEAVALVRMMRMMKEVTEKMKQIRHD